MSTAAQQTQATGWLSGQKWLFVSDGPGRPGYEDLRNNVPIRFLRRRLLGVPKPLLEAVIDVLLGSATVTNPMVEGKTFDGTWRHCRFWWVRSDSQDDHTLELCQLLSTGTGITGPTLLEDGCAYDVYQTFYWNVSTLPTVTASTSGVSYRIEQVYRDYETGLYSCVIERRVRQTQTIAAHTSAADAAGSTATTEWKGVYDGDKDHAGDALSIDAMAPEAGKRKRLSRSKNDDCTQNVQQDIESATPQSVSHASESRADQSTATVWEKNAAAKAEATGGGSGTIVRATSRENEFGKFDNQKDTVTAVALDTGWVNFTTRYGTAYVRWWRNQAGGFGAGTVAPAMLATTSNGFSVQKNEFGLEDGSASRVPYDGGSETDTSPIGWQSRTLYFVQVNDAGTYKRVNSYVEWYQYATTRAGAESETDSKVTALNNTVNKANRTSISQVVLRSKAVRYLATIHTIPTFGSWEAV